VAARPYWSKTIGYLLRPDHMKLDSQQVDQL
jgi:hypothetical protein